MVPRQMRDTCRPVVPSRTYCTWPPAPGTARRGTRRRPGWSASVVHFTCAPQVAGSPRGAAPGSGQGSDHRDTRGRRRSRPGLLLLEELAEADVVGLHVEPEPLVEAAHRPALEAGGDAALLQLRQELLGVLHE